MTNQMRPIHLMLPCPPPTRIRAWGDYYFGNSLATALRQLGHPVEVSMRASGPKLRHRLSDWWRTRNQEIPEEAVELALLGRPSMPERTHRKRIVWLISNSDLIDIDELRAVDHLFVASPAFIDHLGTQGVAADLLLQCTDPDRFSPDLAEERLASKLLFVGNRSQGESRPVVEKAVAAGYDVTVWGNMWGGMTDRIRFGGTHIANEELGKYYASAQVVLNDHRSAMLKDQFISNRVYDSLACGRPVVTEDMIGMPDEFKGCAITYASNDGIVDAIEAACTVPADRLRDVAQLVRDNHSFRRRAEVISARINTITAA